MRKCFVVFKEKDREKIIKLCKSASEKDKTFNYKINPCPFKDGDYILIIFSHLQTKDQAHQRGMYFVKKNKVGEYYWVR